MFCAVLYVTVVLCTHSESWGYRVALFAWSYV